MIFSGHKAHRLTQCDPEILLWASVWAAWRIPSGWCIPVGFASKDLSNRGITGAGMHRDSGQPAGVWHQGDRRGYLAYRMTKPYPLGTPVTLLQAWFVILGMWKWIFEFAMVDMALGGGLKCTKRPYKSTYLRELGLIFTKNQKLLKKSIWARR